MVAEVIDPAVETLERHRELPAHVPYDGIGRRVDQIEFHPDYRRAGEAVWASGILAVNQGGRGAFEQAALFYLLGTSGRRRPQLPGRVHRRPGAGGRAPGLTRTQRPLLPGLFEVDYNRCLRGSQFLTEVQGGSDVGANVARAVPDPTEPGAWRITGEKWFCSVADADLFAVTARPDGAGQGHPRAGMLSRAPEPRRRHPQRLSHPAVEEQARDTLSRFGRDRFRRRPGLAHRWGRGGVPCRRGGAAQHLPVAERRGLDRTHAPCLSGGLDLRASPPGVRAGRRVVSSCAWAVGGDEGRRAGRAGLDDGAHRAARPPQ